MVAFLICLRFVRLIRVELFFFVNLPPLDGFLMYLQLPSREPDNVPFGQSASNICVNLFKSSFGSSLYFFFNFLYLSL